MPGFHSSHDPSFSSGSLIVTSMLRLLNGMFNERDIVDVFERLRALEDTDKFFQGIRETLTRAPIGGEE